MTNPNSPIIATSKTRDGITSYLHEDGTVSNRLTTYGFTTLKPEAAQRFFANIGAVISRDVPRAIKAANRGKFPFLADEDLLASESRARVQRAAIAIYHDRSVRAK